MPRPVSPRGARDTQRLDDLSTAFERFRRTHPGKRFPPALRAGVVAAVNAGVPATAVGRVCGLSWEQVRRWRADPERPSGTRPEAPSRAARVLAVVDAIAPQPVAAEAELELRVGPWLVRLSRAVD